MQDATGIVEAVFGTKSATEAKGGAWLWQTEEYAVES
jgi:hypothetical protein